VSITYTDVFCGAGGSSIGLTEAGLELKLAANHWDRAIETHSANFPHAEHLLADVSNYDMRRLPRTDVLWASPICFPAGTSILTARGVIPIEGVQMGDMVLTHRGRWRPVTRLMRNVSDTVIVRGHGHNALETTPEHPFYARRASRVWHSGVRDYKRELADGREWVEAKNLDSHFWASPLSFGEPVPVPPVGGRGAVFTPGFWWMAGRWLGDGYVRITEAEGTPLPPVSRRRSQPAGSACIMCPNPARPRGNSAALASPYCSAACKRRGARKNPDPAVSRHDVYICCGDHEADGLGARLAAVAPPSGVRAGGGELRWRRTHPATVTVYETSHAGLAEWLVANFGRHAHGKRLPAWALTMPREWREALLEGYMSADGNVRNGSARFSTVSRPLAVGIRLLALSLGLPAGLYAPSTRREGVIEGRTVPMRELWSGGWATDPTPLKRPQHADDGLHRWSAVRSVKEGRRDAEVFNIAVAEDESYVADGIVVHNCTENSPAGGRKRRPKGQLDLLEEAGHVPKEGMERTRATFHDVIRAAEVHQYRAVIVENVTEAAEWELFDWWLSGMTILGYNHQFLSVSSAHVGGEGNARAPQWRDRLYIVFTRKGIRLPDVSPRPLAWCWPCGAAVEAFQAWKKPGRKIGKYGRQYVYCCPNTACGNAVAEPLVLPAASAIDWSDLGTPIGERKRPLADNTMKRIRAGLDMFSRPGSESSVPFLTLLRSGRARDPGADDEALAAVMAGSPDHGLVLPVGGANHDRPPTATGEPLRTRVTRDTDALVTQPFITLLRNGQTAVGADAPLTTVATSGAHHGLTVPPGFLVKNYGGYLTPERNFTPPDRPIGTVTANDHHSLVVPFRGKRCKPTTTGTPLHAMATRDSAALVQPDDADVMECRLRMLKPREHLRAQRFPDSYTVRGNQGEQTMQAGNAVSANVANWLGRAVAEVLA
jgi:site-specific DNA-cytosine methylase